MAAPEQARRVRSAASTLDRRAAEVQAEACEGRVSTPARRAEDESRANMQYLRRKEASCVHVVCYVARLLCVSCGGACDASERLIETHSEKARSTGSRRTSTRWSGRPPPPYTECTIGSVWNAHAR